MWSHRPAAHYTAKGHGDTREFFPTLVRLWMGGDGLALANRCPELTAGQPCSVGGRVQGPREGSETDSDPWRARVRGPTPNERSSAARLGRTPWKRWQRVFASSRLSWCWQQGRWSGEMGVAPMAKRTRKVARQDGKLNERIGRRIRQERLRRNLTLEQVANRAGMHSSGLSQIELGKNAASIASLVRIAKALGVRVSMLLSDV